MKLSVLLAPSLIIISLWWIFQAVWSPGFVHTLARLSYRFTSSELDVSTALLARDRALSYATRGSNQAEDIYFTHDEIRHLVDVSALYKPFSFLLNSVSIFAWGVLILAIHRKEKLKSALGLASKVLLSFVMLSVASLLIFPIFFNVFHEVLFPQGNWAFPIDSMLIRVFPEIFWKLVLSAIVLMLFTWSGIFWLFGQYPYDRSKQ